MKNVEYVQHLQEVEYDFPYHYIPSIDGHKIVYDYKLDWAGRYLLSLELAREVILNTQAKSIIDIGCGDGRLVNDMIPFFPERLFRGVDYSERAINLARSMGNRFDSQVFQCLDIFGESIVPEFDLVLSVEVLEHIPVDMVETFFLRNIAYLRPGGYMFIIVPHTNKPVQKKHFQHFDSMSLKRLVSSAADLEIVELKYLDSISLVQEILYKMSFNKYYRIEFLLNKFLWKQVKSVHANEKICGRIACTVRKSK